MAKKSRVPNPPSPGRRTQFPQQRSSPRTPSVSRRHAALGAAALVALIAVAAVLAMLARGGGASAAEAVRQAGCRYETYPTQPAPHVPPTQEVKYNSFPPPNGPMAEELIVWGAYDEPLVGQRQLVHNLEHGGVAIRYGAKVNASTIARINDFCLESPNGLVVAPLPALGERIALTAWNAPAPSASASEKPDLGSGILARCPRFDGGAFQAFIDAHPLQGSRADGPRNARARAVSGGSTSLG